jgi:hypothetical protein
MINCIYSSTSITVLVRSSVVDPHSFLRIWIWIKAKISMWIRIHYLGHRRRASYQYKGFSVIILKSQGLPFAPREYFSFILVDIFTVCV